MDEVLSVGDGASGQRKAAADILLVLGVDVFGFPDIDGDGHGGVAEGEGQELRFAEFGPQAVGLEVGELDEEEGEAALAPGAAPVVDHGVVEAGWGALVARADGRAGSASRAGRLVQD